MTGRKNPLLGPVGALLAGCALLTACAQPGQLGSPEPAAPAAAPTASPTPAPAPTGPVLLGSGLVQERVTVRTPGPATFSVRTVVLAPGETTGWHLHPGTETSIVNSGSIVLLDAENCAGSTYSAGDALFVPDALVHLARNDGTVPAELVVTYLLAPGAPEQRPAQPAC